MTHGNSTITTHGIEKTMPCILNIGTKLTFPKLEVFLYCFYFTFLQIAESKGYPTTLSALLHFLVQ